MTRGTEKQRDAPGLAQHCYIALRALEDSGSLTIHEIVAAIADGTSQVAANSVSVADVQAVAVAGWIEPLPEDSRRYCLTARGEELLRVASKIHHG
jgi:hypothetical protein